MTADSIRWREKVAYAVGDTASCLYYNTFSVFLIFFYTDTAGLAPAAVGTMLLVTRVWDTMLDPCMGMLADRTQTRWGHFRPWILWMALPYAITGVLTFITPNLSATGRLLYAYITYTLVMMVYTAINIPYGALLGVISPRSDQRTELSSYRFLGAFAGNLIVQGTLLAMVKKFGGGDDRLGFPLTMAVYGFAAMGLFLFTFSATRERVQPTREHSRSVRQDLADLMHNRPWLVLCAMGVLCCTWVSIRNAATVYYFKYFVGSEQQAAAFLVAGTVATLAGVACTPLAIRLLGGKKRTYFILSLINAAVHTVVYWARPSDTPIVYAVQIVHSFITGPLFPMTWAMYADAADYAEWQTGRRATGLIFSAATFSQKIGWTVGAALAGWILAWFGFQANVAQSAGALHGIVLMMSLLPAGISLITAAATLLYNLDARTQRTIEAALLERKTAKV